MKSPRTYVQPDRQTDRRKFYFCLFYLLRHKNHEHSSKGENFYIPEVLNVHMNEIYKKLTTIQ